MRGLSPFKMKESVELVYSLIVTIFYGLNCVPQVHMLKSQPPITQNVTLPGERAFQ